MPKGTPTGLSNELLYKYIYDNELSLSLSLSSMILPVLEWGRRACKSFMRCRALLRKEKCVSWGIHFPLIRDLLGILDGYSSTITLKHLIQAFSKSTSSGSLSEKGLFNTTFLEYSSYSIVHLTQNSLQVTSMPSTLSMPCFNPKGLRVIHHFRNQARALAKKC